MMSKSKTDRRVVRTKKRLHEALLSLILEKGFDRVTVQEILDRADVGRSTFYAHFLNKSDLLIGNMRADRFQLTPDDVSVEVPSVAWMFEHAGDNMALYRALSGSEAMPYVYRNLNEALYTNWVALLERMKTNGLRIELPVDAVASYLSHALIGLLVWWLDNGRPHAAEEMSRVYQNLVKTGLNC